MRNYESYKIIIHKKSQKYLDKLDVVDRTKLVLKIKGLTSDMLHTLPVKKLQGYKQFNRLRVDNYRIIFSVNEVDKILLVLIIGQRKDVYELLKRSNI